MEVKVIGVEDKQGVGKSGKDYDSYILYYAYARDRVVGQACKDKFVDKTMLAGAIKSAGGKSDMLVGKTLDLDFDQGGYLISAELVS